MFNKHFGVLRSIKIIFLFLSISTCGFSQLDNSALFFNARVDTTQDKNVFVKIQNLNFFKNNEYSGGVVEGYTLLGYQLATQLGYQFSKNLSIEGGIFLNKNLGENNFTEVLPVFSLRYFKKDFKLVFGNLDGGLNHQLIEPLYNFERAITNRLENGVQFKINKKKYDFDLWLNWLQVTKRYTDIKEKFQIGLVSNLLKTESDTWEFRLPLQALIYHTGGQLDTLSGSITSIDAAFGMYLARKLKTNFCTKIYLDTRFVRHEKNEYNNNSSIGEYGDGLLANIGFKMAHEMDLQFSYWNGNRFYSDFGGYLYSSKISITGYPNSWERLREILILRFTKKISLAKNINLVLRAEPFYDFRFGFIDYSYGFYISLDENFWLKKSPKFPEE
jgi:hypothetical protein